MTSRSSLSSLFPNDLQIISLLECITNHLLNYSIFAGLLYWSIAHWALMVSFFPYFILRNLGVKIISFSPLIDALLAICVHTRNNSCWNCHQVEADTAVEFLGEFRIQCRLRLCSNCSLKLLYSFNALHQIS